MEWPPITRQCLIFVGEFMVSLAFARFRPIFDKSLILLARPTRSELVTFAFGGQRSSQPGWRQAAGTSRLGLSRRLIGNNRRPRQQ
jgi:hypothetical protein